MVSFFVNDLKWFIFAFFQNKVGDFALPNM